MLREAGFPQGDGLPVLELGITMTEKEIYEYIQGQLSNIGITVKLVVSPVAIHRQMRSTSKLNFFQRNWVGDYRDAENFLGLFYSSSPNGLNNTRFNNAEFDKIFDDAKNELNDYIRHTMYQQMDNIIMEEAAVIPLFYDEVIFLTRTNVSGLETNALKSLVLKRVQIKNEQP